MDEIGHPNAWYESMPTPWMLTSDDIFLWKWTIVKPRKLIDERGISPFQDQYAEWNPSACGSYSASISTNAMNADEGTYGSSPETSSWWKDFWKILLDAGLASTVWGSYQIDNINLLEQKGYIAGKYWCKNQNAVDDAIDSGFAISTGSKEIDWVATRANNNIAVRWEGSAHLFTILGKDDSKQCYIAKDSGGRDKWYSMDKWYFYIPYDMFDTLYTCYALIDKWNQDVIDKIHADKKLLETAIKLGFTNGKFLEAYAERWMAAIMFERIKKYPTTWYSDDELKKLAKDDGIWNGTRENNFVTRYEIALMAASVLGVRTPDDKQSIQAIINMGIMQSAEEKPILREHLIYVIMRVFNNLQNNN